MFGKKQHKAETEDKVTLRDYLTMFDLCSKEIQEEYISILARQPRPERLCGEIVPMTLNHLTYGQLDDLHTLATSKERNPEHRMCEIIFGKFLSLMDEDVNKVYGFLNFCGSEIKRINDLFSSIKTDYSQEEIAAGVKELSFGSFGVLDWYAKRMGITNQNDVRDVAWVRIYTCMKNDNAQQAYERKLQEVYMHKSHSRPRSKHK